MEGEAVVPLEVDDPARVDPPWTRYVAGVVSELRPAAGFTGTVRTTLPTRVGLSSSAALEVAVALALGADVEHPVQLARLCQAAERAGTRGANRHPRPDLVDLRRRGPRLATRLSHRRREPRPAAPEDEVQWVVLVPAGGRTLESSGYAERVRELAVAEAEIGPLRLADVDAVNRLADPQIRRRARHVVTENARVRAFARAIVSWGPRRRGIADVRQPRQPERRLSDPPPRPSTSCAPG